MATVDGLDDSKVPMLQRCGGGTIVGLLTGKVEPASGRTGRPTERIRLGGQLGQLHWTPGKGCCKCLMPGAGLLVPSRGMWTGSGPIRKDSSPNEYGRGESGFDHSENGYWSRSWNQEGAASVPFDQPRALTLIRERRWDEYVFRHGPSAKDKTRRLRGPHWVREKEYFLVRLPALPKNVNYFMDSMVAHKGSNLGPAD
jgi:hypothetical protein